MTSYRIALNFEDGVTRFIDCGAHEKVLDSAFRQRINLPMDCSDGVCGTCKCRAESGSYDMGDDYIEDALTQDEASRGLVLTCQMVPSSDCVISVPVPSTACKTGTSQFSATVNEVLQFGDAPLRQAAALRHAGMVLVCIVVAKVFLIDMAGLQGLLRVFSFLGLGAALVRASWPEKRSASAVSCRCHSTTVPLC